MSSSTGPPPPTAVQYPSRPQPPPRPPSPLGHPRPTEQTVSLGFPVHSNGLALDLADAIEWGKGRIPKAYITIIYLDHFKFSYKDIHQILIKKKFIGADEKLTEEWKGLYRLLLAQATIIIIGAGTPFSDLELGKFLAQGQPNMDTLYECMHLNTIVVGVLVSFNSTCA